MTDHTPTTPPSGDRQHVPTDQAAPELLPCPFCGGEAERQTLPDDEFGNGSADLIACKKCLASSHVEFGYKENLVSAWNRRADLAAPSAPAEVGYVWLERWRHLPHPNAHKIETHPEGAWVRYHEAAEAMTAQQAEIERLRAMERDTYATWKKVAGDLQARAEKAEAVADKLGEWIEAIDARRDFEDENPDNVSNEWDRLFSAEWAAMSVARAAHEKLKGKV